MIEEWKEINGYENYEVSTIGRIRSKTKYVNHNYGGLRVSKGRIRKLLKSGKYIMIDLYPNKTQLLVHRIVADAFIPNPNNYPIVMHKDNNTENNGVDNLMWGTYSMNAKQCVAEGRHEGYETGSGKRRQEV